MNMLDKVPKTMRIVLAIPLGLLALLFGLVAVYCEYIALQQLTGMGFFGGMLAYFTMLTLPAFWIGLVSFGIFFGS